MEAKLVHEAQGLRTYFLVFDKGDEAMTTLAEFARNEELGASQVSGIGAFERSVIAYFDRTRMDYKNIPVDEQVEVLSLLGDIAHRDDGPQPHLHVVLGWPDGTARGGHLFEAHVWPTLEVVLTESPMRLQKERDEETGLSLIRI